MLPSLLGWGGPLPSWAHRGDSELQPLAGHRVGAQQGGGQHSWVHCVPLSLVKEPQSCWGLWLVCEDSYSKTDFLVLS